MSDPIASPHPQITPPYVAAFDTKVNRKSQFPVLLLAIATVCRSFANACLQLDLTNGGGSLCFNYFVYRKNIVMISLGHKKREKRKEKGSKGY